jgi:DNA-binding winged helix-turn-helix (wHTH) protein
MSTQPNAMPQLDSNECVQTPQPVPFRYARFGAFLADFERAELYQNGQRVKVQAKLFQGLVLLLTRAGDVVTREDVRRHLWPDMFLTNLDANVNTTMNKLRQVLGDSPESPVFIETIPRRGYSFIAKVEFSSVPGAPIAERVKTVSDASGSATSHTAGLGAAWSKKHARTVLRVISLLIAGMIVGALLAFVWFFAQAKNQRAATDVKMSAALAGSEFATPVKTRVNPAAAS